MRKDEYIRMFEQEGIHWWYRGLHDLVERYVRKLLEGKSLKILDAGCGTGRLMEVLNRYGDVTGFDSSPEAVAFCSQRGLKNLRTEDLNIWESPPNMYDLIVSNDVLCCEGIKSDLSIIQSFYRALKPKGYLFMNLPAFLCLRRSHDLAVSIRRRYRKNDIVPALQKIGFDSIMAGYRLPLLFVFILLRKSFSVFFRKDAAVNSDLYPLPPFLNELLFSLLRFENRLFVSGIPFFLGSSLFLVCQKSGLARG